MTNTTMTLEVAVTPDDISNGQPGVCEACPVALALRRLLSPNVYVSVDVEEIGLWRRGATSGIAWLHTPIEVDTFVQTFDATEAVEPFTFQLDVPTWSVDEGGSAIA